MVPTVLRRVRGWWEAGSSWAARSGECAGHAAELSGGTAKRHSAELSSVGSISNQSELSLEAKITTLRLLYLVLL